MKRLLLLAILGSSVSAFAQPTYPSTSYATAGETFDYTFAAIDFNFLPGQSGENQLWDFTGLTPLETETIAVLDPSGAGYQSAWCFDNSHSETADCEQAFSGAFNLARMVEVGYTLSTFGITEGIEFTSHSASALTTTTYGMKIESNNELVPVTIDFQDPDTVLQFPLTYGQEYSDTSVCIGDLNHFGVAVDLQMVGTRDVHVDGWGTLQLPNGTLTNVLRVHTIKHVVSDINYFGVPVPLNDLIHSYAFYHADYGLPVLQVDGKIDEAGEFELGFIHYTNSILNTSDVNSTKIVLYPNPSSTSFSISGVEEHEILRIQIYNQLGQKVGNSTQVAHLANGIYTVEVETAAGRMVERLIKK